ncbi:substrate-binding periplasmic protein [Dictyobacter arantiisoli]|uniref:Amino acid ABC transporter substrate-binding protein n=1 Tax=Dictyobacter arantiisoli TaxID=2014874 RepID=A0A5A5T9U1_9CHLR|nr:ABC transporter substrate-binding protein [Dictyobacter arantiisoli]GCF07783.1 amino acid ABC transporter substrate-binding protein [Dictyobacter arantiisoli]
MTHNVKRRVFLQRASQVGGLVLAGGVAESLLAACGGNVPTSGNSNGATKTTKVGNQGLKLSGVLQWGATSNNGAPYVYRDPKTGKLVGFEMEIAAAIASLMGVTQKQIEIDYAQLDQSLQTGAFDVILNGWEITEDRKKTELFSQSYYRNGQQIVVRANDPRFASKTANDNLSLKDLEGYTVGTGAGFGAEVLLASDKKITLKSYDPDLPFNDLALGRIDAVLIDYSTVTYYALGYGSGGSKNAALKLIGKPFDNSDYVIAFDKNSPNAVTLQKEIDQALTILKGNGTLKDIYNRWGLWTDAQPEIGIK